MNKKNDSNVFPKSGMIRTYYLLFFTSAFLFGCSSNQKPDSQESKQSEITQMSDQESTKLDTLPDDDFPFDNSIIPESLIQYIEEMTGDYRLPDSVDYDIYYFDGYSHAYSLPYYCNGHFNCDSATDYALVLIKDSKEQLIISFRGKPTGYDQRIFFWFGMIR